jgi:hypothetical protein
MLEYQVIKCKVHVCILLASAGYVCWPPKSCCARLVGGAEVVAPVVLDAPLMSCPLLNRSCIPGGVSISLERALGCWVDGLEGGLHGWSLASGFCGGGVLSLRWCGWRGGDVGDAFLVSALLCRFVLWVEGGPWYLSVACGWFWAKA